MLDTIITGPTASSTSSPPTTSSSASSASSVSLHESGAWPEQAPLVAMHRTLHAVWASLRVRGRALVVHCADGTRALVDVPDDAQCTCLCGILRWQALAVMADEGRPAVVHVDEPGTGVSYSAEEAACRRSHMTGAPIVLVRREDGGEDHLAVASAVEGRWQDRVVGVVFCATGTHLREGMFGYTPVTLTKRAVELAHGKKYRALARDGAARGFVRGQLLYGSVHHGSMTKSLAKL